METDAGDAVPAVGRARSAGPSNRRTTAEIAADPSVPGADELVQVVALDGPAGTGKSSVARGVATALGWRFVDTGATYRAATLAALRAGTALDDTPAVESVVAGSRIELVTDPEAARVLLDGEDVSAPIRTAEVTAAVSAVSAVPGVRALMIVLQRDATGTQGAVVEGRDIATVVAPRAVLKVYLDARPEVRAQRRTRELQGAAAGTADAVPVNEGAVGASLALRDGRDNQTNRLEASEGAVHLDTSDLTLDQVIAAIVALVRRLDGVHA